jgi:hypothetical protein
VGAVSYPGFASEEEVHHIDQVVVLVVAYVDSFAEEVDDFVDSFAEEEACHRKAVLRTHQKAEPHIHLMEALAAFAGS